MSHSALERFGLRPKILTTLRDGYRAADFRDDAVAGLTVAIVALPLAMALGVASGATPDKGIVTAIVAGFCISLFGGSRVQIGGPTGAFVVVVSNVIATHGYDGMVLATLLAGLMLVAAGAANLGQVIRLIPHPVVTGFTAGIAVIIAASQIKEFLGLRIAEVPADFVPKLVVLAGVADSIDAATAVLGLGCLALILILRRLAPRLPGYLIAVVAAVAAVKIFGLDVDTVGARFPEMPTGLPMPSWPEFNLTMVRDVLPSAFTIAFLAGIEALLSAVVADGLTGYRHRSNQELFGQGLANVASAYFAGLPATGAIARTATNIKAGGRTPIAGVMHAVFLLVFIIFGSELMKLVPLAALAAILFVVAWGMSECERFIHLLRIPSDDRGVLLLTFGLTVLVDLTVAIAVGVILAALIFMGRMTRSLNIGRGAAAEEDADSDEGENQRGSLPPGVEVFRLSGPVFFGVARELLDTLKRMGQPPKVLILRMRLVPYLDTTGASALRDLVDDSRAIGVNVIFSGVPAQPMSLLGSLGLGSGSSLVTHAPGYSAALEAARKIVFVEADRRP